MASDLELLEAYAWKNSEESFAALVNRHLNLVYSAALRQVRSPQLAEEVAQSVFTDLSRNAAKLKPDTILTAWLYQVTRRTAIDVVRREARRQLREQIATEMNTLNTDSLSRQSGTPADEWSQVEPMLDDAMETLDAADRTAVLLRYFENKSLREVGAALGTSDDAAQKRVSRAVERLREFLAKRGVTVGAGGLAVVLAANAVQAAPAGLTATISAAAALAGTATTAATVIVTATKALAMTTMQKTLIAAILGLAAGTGIYEARQASTLRTQVEMLQHQQAPPTEQIQQLQRERDDATNQLASLVEEIRALKNNSAELLRLRAEVSRLRSDANDPGESSAKSWLTRVNELKRRLEQTPGAKIPELQFLTEESWLDAAKGEFKTDEDYRKAMAALRMEGTMKFGLMLQAALTKYARANHWQFPTDLSQLQPYSNDPLDSAILQRYQIIPGIYVGNRVTIGDWAITQKAPVDEQYEVRVSIGMNGIEQSFRTETDGALDAAIRAFSAANNGSMPTGIHDLKPYVTTPAEQEALQKRIVFNATNLPPNSVPFMNPESPTAATLPPTH